VSNIEEERRKREVIDPKEEFSPSSKIINCADIAA